MNGLLLDHLQGFLVILYNNVPAIEICVKLLEATAHGQTLSFNICIASLDINKGFTGKGNRPAALYEGSA